MVIQPDGDWVWISDGGPFLAYSPAAGHAVDVSPLSIFNVFNDAGRLYIFGSRASVCDSTGEVYVSFSGGPGGTAIFRIDEPLTTASHLVNIEGAEGDEPSGLQDLVVGPSSIAGSAALYFTVHDYESNCEQVWELTLPECNVPLVVDLASFEAEVVADGVELTWKTVREADNLGFRILRERVGLKSGTHPTILTPELIPAAGTELTGSSYAWTDRSKQVPGEVRYYLEDVDRFGRATRHEPVTVLLPAPLKPGPDYDEDKPRPRTRSTKN